MDPSPQASSAVSCQTGNTESALDNTRSVLLTHQEWQILAGYLVRRACNMSLGILHHIDISPLDYLPILEYKPLRASCLQTGNKIRENQKENHYTIFHYLVPKLSDETERLWR